MAGSLGDGEIYTVEDVAPFLGMTPNGVRSACIGASSNPAAVDPEIGSCFMSTT